MLFSQLLELDLNGEDVFLEAITVRRGIILNSPLMEHSLQHSKGEKAVGATPLIIFAGARACVAADQVTAL